MMKNKLIAGMTAVMLFGSMLPAVPANADADVFASIEAVSLANQNYNVTATKTDLTGWTVTAARDNLFRILGNDYTSDYYTENITVVNSDGDILVNVLSYGEYYDEETDSYGYMDRDCHIADGVISIYGRWESPEFPSCGEYYDYHGNVLFDHPDYVTNSEMINGIAVVRYYVDDELRAFVINDKGETVLELPDSFAEWDDMMWNYKANPIWYSGGVFNFGASGVAFGDTIFESSEYDGVICGYMDLEGNVVIPQVYDDVYPFFDGLAAVMRYDEESGSTYAYINKNGEIVIPFGKYDQVGNFTNGYAWVGKTDEDYGYLYGYINTDGEEIIPINYTNLGMDDNGSYFYASKDGHYGYIDQNNNVVIPFEYYDAFGESENLFTVANDSWQYGIVDKNNEAVVPLIFDDISAVQNGVAYAVLNEEVYRLEITAEGGEDPGELPDVLEDGDLNGDEAINSKDAAMVLKAAALIGSGNENGLLPVQEAAADVDKNGIINSRDAAFILIYAARIGAGDTSVTLEDVVKEASAE